MEEDFGIFVVHIMEWDFRISWSTPWRLKMVFMVYTMEAKIGFCGEYSTVLTDFVILVQQTSFFSYDSNSRSLKGSVLSVVSM